MILDSDVLLEILRSNLRTSRWVAVQASRGETPFAPRPLARPKSAQG